LSAPDLSIAEGCRLMGIARSTFYDKTAAMQDDTAIVEAISRICEEFEFYGWRRVRAELRHRGLIVNRQRPRPADLSQSRQGPGD
jgi:hypothetical protein